MNQRRAAREDMLLPHEAVGAPEQDFRPQSFESSASSMERSRQQAQQGQRWESQSTTSGIGRSQELRAEGGADHWEARSSASTSGLARRSRMLRQAKGLPGQEEEPPSPRELRDRARAMPSSSRRQSMRQGSPSRRARSPFGGSQGGDAALAGAVMEYGARARKRGGQLGRWLDQGFRV